MVVGNQNCWGSLLLEILEPSGEPIYTVTDPLQQDEARRLFGLDPNELRTELGYKFSFEEGGFALSEAFLNQTKAILRTIALGKSERGGITRLEDIAVLAKERTLETCELVAKNKIPREVVFEVVGAISALKALHEQYSDPKQSYLLIQGLADKLAAISGKSADEALKTFSQKISVSGPDWAEPEKMLRHLFIDMASTLNKHPSKEKLEASFKESFRLARELADNYRFEPIESFRHLSTSQNYRYALGNVASIVTFRRTFDNPTWPHLNKEASGFLDDLAKRFPTLSRVELVSKLDAAFKDEYERLCLALEGSSPGLLREVLVTEVQCVLKDVLSGKVDYAKKIRTVSQVTQLANERLQSTYSSLLNKGQSSKTALETTLAIGELRVGSPGYLNSNEAYKQLKQKESLSIEGVPLPTLPIPRGMVESIRDVLESAFGQIKKIASNFGLNLDEKLAKKMFLVGGVVAIASGCSGGRQNLQERPELQQAVSQNKTPEVPSPQRGVIQSENAPTSVVPPVQTPVTVPPTSVTAPSTPVNGSRQQTYDARLSHEAVADLRRNEIPPDIANIFLNSWGVQSTTPQEWLDQVTWFHNLIEIERHTVTEVLAYKGFDSRLVYALFKGGFQREHTPERLSTELGNYASVFYRPQQESGHGNNPYWHVDISFLRYSPSEINPYAELYQAGFSLDAIKQCKDFEISPRDALRYKPYIDAIRTLPEGAYRGNRETSYVQDILLFLHAGIEPERAITELNFYEGTIHNLPNNGGYVQNFPIQLIIRKVGQDFAAPRIMRGESVADIICHWNASEIRPETSQSLNVHCPIGSGVNFLDPCFSVEMLEQLERNLTDPPDDREVIPLIVPFYGDMNQHAFTDDILCLFNYYTNLGKRVILVQAQTENDILPVFEMAKRLQRGNLIQTCCILGHGNGRGVEFTPGQDERFSLDTSDRDIMTLIGGYLTQGSTVHFLSCWGGQSGGPAAVLSEFAAGRNVTVTGFSGLTGALITRTGGPWVNQGMVVRYVDGRPK